MLKKISSCIKIYVIDKVILKISIILQYDFLTYIEFDVDYKSSMDKLWSKKQTD